jgi:phage major head subunit gpT-like protein
MEDLNFKSILKRSEFFSLDESTHEETEKTIDSEIIEIDTQESFSKMINELGDSFAVVVDDLSFKFAKENKEYVLYSSGAIFNINIDSLPNLSVWFGFIL